MNDMIFIIGGIICIYIYLAIFAHEEKKRYKTHKVTGDIGENIVAKKLALLSDDFAVENNVHIGGNQIDHLVVSKSAGIVFVIETKLWGGIITGGYSESQWEQNKNGQIRYFENPIMQNRHHCSVVKRYYRGYEVKNVVVFVRNDNVPKYKNIIRVNDLVGYINRVTDEVLNRCVISM